MAQVKMGTGNNGTNGKVGKNGTRMLNFRKPQTPTLKPWNPNSNPIPNLNFPFQTPIPHLKPQTNIEMCHFYLLCHLCHYYLCHFTVPFYLCRF